MLIDPNWGDGAMMLFSLDPAVENEENAHLLNPELDLYNPQNDFTAKGAGMLCGKVNKHLAQGLSNS
jgi:hypothetical protein